MLEKFSMIRILYIFKCLELINPEEEVTIIDPY